MVGSRHHPNLRRQLDLVQAGARRGRPDRTWVDHRGGGDRQPFLDVAETLSGEAVRRAFAVRGGAFEPMPDDEAFGAAPPPSVLAANIMKQATKLHVPDCAARLSSRICLCWSDRMVWIVNRDVTPPGC